MFYGSYFLSHTPPHTHPRPRTLLNFFLSVPRVKCSHPPSRTWKRRRLQNNQNVFLIVRSIVIMEIYADTIPMLYPFLTAYTTTCGVRRLKQRNPLVNREICCNYYAHAFTSPRLIFVRDMFLWNTLVQCRYVVHKFRKNINLT